MNESTRNSFRNLPMAVLLGIVSCLSQPVKNAIAENTFPQDGAGYEWNSVTWAENPLVYSVPWKCEKCDTEHVSVTLSGQVDVDYSNQTTGRRGTRRVIVWVNVREKDTREMPDVMDVFLRRDGIRIDAIETDAAARGSATIKKVYRENRQHQRHSPEFPWENNGLVFYAGADNSEWMNGTLMITTVPCRCQNCSHTGAPTQLLTGTVKRAWVLSTEVGHRNYGKRGWATRPVNVSSFLHPNDTQSIPVPVEVYAADDNYQVYLVDLSDESSALATLRREWETANHN